MPVSFVAGTKIFARGERDGRQLLVYSMTAAAAEDLAMILPLPVPVGSAEDAVRFIDLSSYPRFFTDLASAFVVPQRGRGEITGSFAPIGAALLQVHEVGDFEASFVPTVADFARLDSRFRLPTGVWDRLPAYRNYGFAVFKLRLGGDRRLSPVEAASPKPPPRRSLWQRLFAAAPSPPPPPQFPGHFVKSREIHPMAFSFPRREPGTLFFPTVHIHDGQVHEHADFDHVLFAQADPKTEAALAAFGQASQGPLGQFMDEFAAAGIILGGAPAYQRVMRGTFKNTDQRIG